LNFGVLTWDWKSYNINSPVGVTTNNEGQTVKARRTPVFLGVGLAQVPVRTCAFTGQTATQKRRSFFVKHTPQPRTDKYSFFTSCASCHRSGKMCNDCREREKKKREEKNASVSKQNYYAYINSQDWKDKSERAKKRAGYRCQLCNSPQGEVKLNTHHRTYERLGNEQYSDLIVLCQDCHNKFHNQLKRSVKRTMP